MNDAATDRHRNRLGRRRLVQATVALALVAAGSAGWIARTRGYALPPGRRLQGLSPWQFIVLESAARRIVAPDRADASIPTADDTDVAGFVDEWVARMHADVRRDFGRFLGYLEHVAPLALGLPARFSRLPSEDQDRVLSSIEASSSDLLRAGFDGLKSLVFMGYYRDPRAWSIVGYDGPTVRRPAAGWR